MNNSLYSNFKTENLLLQILSFSIINNIIFSNISKFTYLKYN